jgi:release factor glutamine methyltransferase
MTFGLYKNYLVQQLGSIYSMGEAKEIACMVFEKLTTTPKASQYLLEKQELNLQEQVALSAYEQELLTGKPVQYVLGEAWFLNKKFKVDERVLIPRPETEELVLWVKEYAETRKNEALKILDVGTGSGCIPVSLNHLLPNVAITALEVSKGALEVAIENADFHNSNIQFLFTDFLVEDTWTDLGTFDIIISNPPYIPENEKEELDENVVAWEPHLALFTPNYNPLLFYTALEKFCRNHLKKNGVIFLEGHQLYIHEIAGLFSTSAYEVVIRKDINYNDRMIAAKKS